MHSIQFPKNRISRIVNEIFCVTVIPLCLFPFAVSRGAEYQLPDNGNTIFAQPGAGEGNTVLINDSVTGGGWAIIGGYTSGADAGWNKIITDNVAKDIQIGMSILGGLKQAGTGAANSNEIRLANSGGTTTVSGDIRGGFNQGTGNADNNEIHLENTVVAGAVQGGIASRAGDTLENKVSMTGGSVAGSVAGGYIDGTGSGRADGNRVSLGNASVGQNIEGGFNLGTGEGSASQNEVAITVDSTAADGSGFQIGGFVAGGVMGQQGEGNANSNKVTVTNTSARNFLVKSYVAGGYNQGTGNADNNEIHLENTAVTGAVQGGIASHTGDTLENKVSMTGGSVAGSVAGGYIDGTGSGRADGNRVSLAGTSVVQGITGGLNYGSGKSSASSNTVFINHVDGNTGSLNGAAEGPAFRTGKSPDVSPDETGAYVVGGHISYMGEGDTNDNHVIINNAHVKQYIVGGENEGSDSPDVTVPSGQSNANNNIVYLENAELSEYDADGAVIPRHYVVGGLVGSQKNGNANGNAVTLVNSRFTGKYIAAGLNQGTGEVAGNTVRLEDSTVYGIVAGGLDWGYGRVNLTGNHVIIRGGKVIRDLTGQGDEFQSAMAIAGARSLEGERVEKNMVSLGQTEIVGNVAGGANQEGGNARENVVTVTGSTIQGYVGGGYINGAIPGNNGEEGHADGNTVTITNTHVKALKMENGDVVNDGNIGGGYNQGIGTVSADNNNISISVEDNEPIVGMKAGETDTRFEVEGFVAGGVIGQNGTGSTNNNTVTIINSSTRGKTLHIGNYVAGGYNDGEGGHADGNTVTIKKAEVGTYIAGGYNTGTGKDVSVNQNTVNLEEVSLTSSGGTDGHFVVGGVIAGNNESGTVSGNNLTIRDSTLTVKYVAAGVNQGSGNVTGNSVKLENSTVYGIVAGGLDRADENAVIGGMVNLTGNMVRITGGSVQGDIMGARDRKEGGGMLRENRVILDGVGHVTGNVTGGLNQGRGSALQNKVAITGSTIQGYVNGGFIDSSVLAAGESKEGQADSSTGEARQADGNTVTVTNTRVKANGGFGGNIHGGFNQGEGAVSADNNEVFLSVRDDNDPAAGMKAGKTDTGFDVEGFVAGGVIGQNGTGSTNNNTVTIINSSTRGKSLHIKNYVAGGYNEGTSTSTSTSTGNTVRLEAGGDVQLAVDGFVIGGYVRSGEAGNTDSNTVTITNGAVGDVNSPSSYVAGGLNDGTGSASGNRVVLAGNTIVRGSGVVGGSVTGATNNAGKQDAFPEQREAGYSTGTGQNGESADLAVVRNNTVMVSDDVRVEGGRVAGGESVAGQPGKSGIATIESNTVTVNGGVISADVYGGTAVTGRVLDNTVNLNGGALRGKVFAGNSLGVVKDNTVNLDGKNGIDITGAWLIGSGQHVATGQNGNTLNIRNFKGRAQNIGNFDRIDLDLAGLTLRAGDPIIVLTEKETTRLGNSTIHLHTAQKAIAHTNSALVPRYEVIKNKTDAGLTAENVKYEKGQVTVREKGALQALYKVEWDGPGIDSVDGDSIDLVKTGETEIVPGTETINESRLALTDFLNAAGDFILDRKLQCSLREDGSIPETCFYGAVSGGDLHHDLNGNKAWAHTTGTHWFLGIRSKLNEKQDTEKDLNGALYIEAGWGNVDTHNRWAKGNGNIHYYGIGAIGERKQKEGDWKGTYLQAHARIGRAFSDYNSRLKDGSGEKLDYDKNSTYYGAGLEIGREWQYHPDYMLDSYLKYRWLHLNGFNTEINGADHKLDDIDSHRTRLGTRLNYTAEKTGMPYIGIAWEHEFDGNARGSVMGYSLKDTSLKGDSGVLELGVKFVPSEKSRWNYDFTIEGYVGQREGVMGNFVVNYLF